VILGLIGCAGIHGERSAAAPSSQVTPLFPDQTVARGRDFEIKRSQLDEAYIAMRAAFAARGQSLPPSDRDAMEALLVDRLVLVQLLLRKVTEADRAIAVTNAERAFRESRAQAGSEESFKRQLTALGVEPEVLRKRLLEQTLVEQVVARDFYDQVEIRGDQVKRYYDENPRQFERPEMVKVRYLAIATVDRLTGRELTEEERKGKRDLAERLLKRAKQGEDFERMVREYSEDPVSRERGGEYAFGRAQDNALLAASPEFEKAAFALRPKEFSEVIGTRFGFHILQLLERIPPQRQTLAEAGADIRRYLQRQEGRPKLPAYFERLKQEANVEIVDPKLKRTLPAQTQPVLPGIE
jgi:peptidyl-prolyl cis-trans isomerase C